LLTSVGVDNDSQCILLIFEDSNKSDFITLWSEEMVNIIPLIPTY
jgi:hypothetical protein